MLSPQSTPRASLDAEHTEREITRFRLAYLTTIGLVAALILLVEAGLGLSATAVRDAEALINKAGRQRMLSQRIAKHGFQLRDAAHSGDGVAFGMHGDRLSTDLRTFNVSHEELTTRGSDGLFTVGESDRARALLDEIHPWRERIDAGASVLLAADPGSVRAGDLDVPLQQLVHASDGFLPLMHELVNAYEAESVAARSRLMWIELSLGAVTLAVLGMGVVFVLEPARRRMIDQQRALSLSKTASDRAAAEVAAFRTALDEHSIVSITDVRGTIVDVNAGFCRISGYTREELLGENHRVLNSGHHPPKFWRDMWRTISSGRAWRGEVCNRAKDGSLYWVDSTIVPYLGPDGELEQYVSIRFDITETKRAFSELASAEALLAQTGRAAHIGGWEINLETMTPVWSEEVCRIHEVPAGYTPTLEEATAFYPEGARERVEASVQAAIGSGEGWDLEVPFVTAKGNRRWVRAIGTPVVENGRCVKLWGAFQDITDNVETRERLAKLQRRFERATTGATDGLWEHRIANDAVWYSDQFKRLIGLEPGEFGGFAGHIDSWRSLLHPDDIGPTMDAVREHLERNTPYDVRHRLRMPGGGYRWFRARGQATRDEHGRATLLSGSLTDIHEQYTAETRLDLATRSARIGLWDWDLLTDDVYYNDTYLTMLGYEPGELPMGLETWKGLVHPDDLDGAIEAVMACHSGAATEYRAEFRARRKDGDWNWIRAEGETVERLADGTPKRMIGVHVDIQSMREAMDRAEAASRAKTDFLANMSHEIRTPMTAILGYTDIISDPEAREVDFTDHIQTIQRNAQHLMSIINDILDVSKIEAGQLKIESVPMSPTRIVEDVASLLRPRAIDKGVSIDVETGPGLPAEVVSDPLRMRQILLNLAGNAVKFTEEGSVTIGLRFDPGTRSLLLEVRDTGIGMTPAQVESISRFEAFNQADSSTTRRFGGTGLGLRISKSLVDMLGGTMRLESESGEGTTFSVTVPVAEVLPASVGTERGGTDGGESRKPREGLPGGPLPDLSGVSVLVAEDGPDNQRLLRFLLEKQSATVRIVDNGAQAVAAIEEASPGDHPDVVLMDMQMPVLDGYEATRTLRSLGYVGPIIAFTADALEGACERCLSAGCNDYLTKPIDRHALIRACERWARGEGSSPGAEAA